MTNKSCDCKDVARSVANRRRCDWPGDDTLMVRYHDEEWGLPVHNDRTWFSFIVLDTFQAGLSWRTVLHKREALRQVFHQFDPVRVASMTDNELEAARSNAAIIRNRLKIYGTRQNAQAFLSLQERYNSFDAYIWSFTDGRTIHNEWRTLAEVPSSTPLSDCISKALKKEGFTFVGTTICYALLQAAGVVNDHLIQCFRHREVGQLSNAEMEHRNHSVVTSWN